MNQNTELRPLLSYCLPISPHTDLSFLEDKGSQKVLPQLQTCLWSSALNQSVPGQVEPEAKAFTSALQSLDLSHSNVSYDFSWVSFEYFNHEELCWLNTKQKQKRINKRILLEREYFPWHWFCWLCTSRADPRMCISTPLTGWIHRNFQGPVAAGIERGTGERLRIRLETQAAPHQHPSRPVLSLLSQQSFFLLLLEK